MTPDRFAVPGLLLMVASSILAAMGLALSVAAVPLGLGVALMVCAAHEALIDRGSRH